MEVKELIIGTKQGMLIRFPEKDVRSMGRTAAGVKGITLSDDDHVVGMDIIEENHDVLIVTEKGYGKRTPIEEYRIQNRGGKGIKTCNITDRNGSLVSLKVVSSDHDIMIITVSGVIIRTQVEGISTTGRNTQGVTLIRVNEGEEVATVARIEVNDEDIEETEETVEHDASENVNEQSAKENETLRK